MFLVSRYQDAAIDALPNLRYCTAGTISSASPEATDTFKRYWQSRGFGGEQASSLSLTGGPGATTLIAGEMATIRRRAQTYPGESKNETAGGSRRATLEGKKSTLKSKCESPLLPPPVAREFAPAKTFSEKLQELGRKPLTERVSIAGNSEEMALFNAFSSTMRIQREIGSGSFATVKMVEIDGQKYALRIEHPRSASQDLLAWKKNKIQERATTYMLEEIARANPNLTFLTPHLSFVEGNDFITLMPLLKGDLFSALKSGSLRQGADSQAVAQIISTQLKAMHQGVPFDLGGESYTLSFMHRDIKAENIGFTKEGRPVFFDFGHSKAVVSKIAEDGKTKVSVLTLYSAGKWQLTSLVNAKEGTPDFMDSELWTTDFTKLTSEETLAMMRDSDIHALNVVNFELKIRKFYMPALAAHKQYTGPMKDVNHYSAFYAKFGGIRISKRGERRLIPWDNLLGVKNVCMAWIPANHLHRKTQWVDIAEMGMQKGGMEAPTRLELVFTDLQSAA